MRSAALLVALACICSSLLLAQDDDWQLSYTVNGHPDLQGVWANNSITPLERAAGFEGREFLTAQEYARLQAGGRLADCQGIL